MSSSNNNSSDFASHARDEATLAPGLRILCLHDGSSTASKLSDQLEGLGERLYENHMIDLVYVNAPLLVRRSSSSSTAAGSCGASTSTSRCTSTYSAHNHPSPPTSHNNSDEADRVWWEKQNDETPFAGLDASLLLLRQVWTSMPFWGILAVGQGAGVASMLPLLPVSPMPSFCVFVNGEAILEETERLMDDLMCLHVIVGGPYNNSNDNNNNNNNNNASPINPSTERLVQQFGGHVFVTHGSKTLFSKPTLNTIGKFLVSQKKLLKRSGSGNVLALHNQLYWVEQEAANMVAQQIVANDPPKALMAVISPQQVGGWAGRKRRGPKEEGGGAPCPSEFLLKREKRTTNPNGPTREHPNQHHDHQQQEKEQQQQEEGTTAEHTNQTASTTINGDDSPNKSDTLDS